MLSNKKSSKALPVIGIFSIMALLLLVIARAEVRRIVVEAETGVSTNVQTDVNASDGQYALFSQPSQGNDQLYIGVVGMSSVAPLYVGRSGTEEFSQRFIADRTGSITKWKAYFKYGSGYSGGDGGVVRVRITTNKSGNVPDLSNFYPGEIRVTPNLGKGGFDNQREYTFSSPIPVEKGKTYHIVLDNVRTSTGWISLNNTYDMPQNLTSPGIIGPSDRADLRTSRKRSAGWYDQEFYTDGGRYTPIVQLTFSDGSVYGNSFLEWERERTFSFSGSKALRTTIRLPVDTTISNLAARTLSSSRTIKIELVDLDDGGRIVRNIEKPATARPNYRNQAWVEGDVAPFTMRANRNYALVVRAGSGYSGSIVPLKNGASQGYNRLVGFPYGKAQTSSNGSSWSDWGGGTFYFPFAIR